MSYSGISIREAMDKLNSLSNGWFLPQVQRQYVWGARYESETYICLLLDSLYRRYPIGGLVVWETMSKVPHRAFLDDYFPGMFARMLDEGRWSHSKGLVYDGQQRLQTLRSVLHFTFNGRVLCFNLLFDHTTSETDETGFFFTDQGEALPLFSIRMTELSGMDGTEMEKTRLEQGFLKNANLDEKQELICRSNISGLWSVFVQRDIKSIAYFPVHSNDEREVNEVFRRLNTGGIMLTQIEIVLSKIKAQYPDYEENLWRISTEIESRTCGYSFSSAEVLQFFYLLVLGTTRVDETRVRTEHLPSFSEVLKECTPVLYEFFGNYIWDLLKINHSSIIPRQQALLPIAVYLAARKRAGASYEFKRFSADNLLSINQYLILSQFCDWNTQTMVNAFCQQATVAGTAGTDFPIDSIRQIALNKSRSDTLYYHQFIGIPWLALKLLTPNRVYIFHESTPEVDHIFPIELAGGDEAYKSRVDVLWNLQPMPAGVNNYKRAKHPKDFFLSADGAKYITHYDFLPPIEVDWGTDARRFIRYRHRQMRKSFAKMYGFKLKRLRVPRAS